MISSRTIKRRIKSAKNISQITRAMQMVAATKMKKAQARAVAGKPYAEKIHEAVVEFAGTLDSKIHPLFGTFEKSDTVLIVLIATNKGLCGGLNSALFRAITSWFKTEKRVYTLMGKKGRGYTIRTGTVIADFSDDISEHTIPAITSLIVNEYLKGTYSSVWIAYNEFISALRYEPTRVKILPFTFPDETAEEKKTANAFIVEPSDDEVLDALLPHYLEIQVQRGVWESEASEHSARMIAMKNATDNAEGLMDILSLEYNKIRQQQITFEIADMVTARMSVE